MSKYEPLKAFLTRQHAPEVAMKFHEIETLLGGSLPRSAFKHRAWWSNNASNSVMTHAWLDAGYVTERVDMGSQHLVFRRTDHGSGSSPATGAGGAPTTGGVLARMRKALAGTARPVGGVDLSGPTGEAWAADAE